MWPQKFATGQGGELPINSVQPIDGPTFYDERAFNRPKELQRGYHHLLKSYYQFLVPEASRVLEMGCGGGDLLASIKPSRGVGIDYSVEMVNMARERHPECSFETVDAMNMPGDEKFDYILMSDLVNDAKDVQQLFEQAQRHAFQHTRLVVNFFNSLWRPVLRVAEWFGAKSPTPPQNWLSMSDVKNLLHLAGWEVIKTDHRILWPVSTPLVGPFFNRYVAPFLKHLCLTQFIVARPRPLPSHYRDYSCTVVIPARNEAGNIEAAIQRTPELGMSTEILFVEGHSTDNTWDEIQRVIKDYPDRNIRAMRQSSKGKGGAVREAFATASGQVLFILDADLTMPPEDLPKFYDVIKTGCADFVNGVRLVYPMEEEAMRFFNMLGNKFFSLAFSWLLGQPIKDTLCGTKVLFRKDYEAIAQNRKYFGDFDPFGDFDLLFGAAKLNRRMMDLPIRYQARTYGETNISRWRHGCILLRMVGFAARRLKFFT